MSDNPNPLTEIAQLQQEAQKKAPEPVKPSPMVGELKGFTYRSHAYRPNVVRI